MPRPLAVVEGAVREFGASDPLLLAEQATPSNPASGTGLIYPKSDGFWYVKDDGGAERRIDITTHGGLSGVGTDDHHNQAHDHSAAGDGTALAPTAFTFPASTGAAPTVEGSAEWDSDDHRLKIGDGSGTQEFWPGLADTGWTALTLSAPFANTAYQPLQYHRVGTTVTVTGEFKNNSGLSQAANTTVATLPVGFRPSVYVRPVTLTVTGVVGVYINPSGGTIQLTDVLTDQVTVGVLCIFAAA